MHSPVRSESDVFRGVVIIAAGAVLIGVLAALTDTAVGALAAAVLIGVGLAATWLRARGTLPEGVEVARGGGGTHRILVVANQTIEGEELLAEIVNRAAGKSSCRILLVCPALTGTRLQHLASDVDAAREEAERRLERSLAAVRGAGLEAEGLVGDEDPFAAATDALASFGADEVIISTLPPDRSRWLERGVVGHLRRDVPLPVTHVVVDPEPREGAGAARVEAARSA